MSPALILTFAELVALIDLAPGSRTACADRILGPLDVQADRRTDAVRQAGLASLLARDLISADGESLVLASGPQLVVSVASTLRSVLEVGVVHREGGDGMVVLDGTEARLAISPRAFGCFAVASLEVADPLPDQLVAITDDLLGTADDSVVAIVPAGATPEPGASVVIGVERGRWFLASTGPESVRRTGTREELFVDLTATLVTLTR